MSSTKARISTAMGLAAALALTGCSSIGDLFSSTDSVAPGKPGAVQGFLGGVVADEPQAALIGRNILSAGGTAADAVAAMGFTLAVTLPSRAGLGASGACLAYDPSRNGPGDGEPEAVLFPAVAPAHPGNADRPASVPMLARGLYALQARYGRLPIEKLIVPAEQYARFGVPVSRALLRDLAVVQGPLAADPGAQVVFFKNGRPLMEGDTLLQSDLGGTIAQMRVSGLGDLYQGLSARKLDEAMPAVGGGLTVADLRTALPRVVPPLLRAAPNNDQIAALPGPEAGGAATIAALEVLVVNMNKAELPINEASAHATNVAVAMRKGDKTAEQALTSSLPVATLGALPASTTFGAVDRDGHAVMCATSMGNLFGTGRIAPGTGILLAVSPARAPQPLLAITMLFNGNSQQFHGMAGGSGQQAAPIAAAVGLVDGVLGKLPAMPPEPGRASVIACPAYLPKTPSSCAWSADPRNLGLAIGSN